MAFQKWILFPIFGFYITILCRKLVFSANIPQFKGKDGNTTVGGIGNASLPLDPYVTSPHQGIQVQMSESVAPNPLAISSVSIDPNVKEKDKEISKRSTQSAQKGRPGKSLKRRNKDRKGQKRNTPRKKKKRNKRTKGKSTNSPKGQRRRKKYRFRSKPKRQKQEKCLKQRCKRKEKKMKKEALADAPNLNVNDHKVKIIEQVVAQDKVFHDSQTQNKMAETSRDKSDLHSQTPLTMKRKYDVDLSVSNEETLRKQTDSVSNFEQTQAVTSTFAAPTKSSASNWWSINLPPPLTLQPPDIKLGGVFPKLEQTQVVSTTPKLTRATGSKWWSINLPPPLTLKPPETKTIFPTTLYSPTKPPSSNWWSIDLPPPITLKPPEIMLNSSIRLRDFPELSQVKSEVTRWFDEIAEKFEKRTTESVQSLGNMTPKSLAQPPSSGDTPIREATHTYMQQLWSDNFSKTTISDASSTTVSGTPEIPLYAGRPKDNGAPTKKRLFDKPLETSPTPIVTEKTHSEFLSAILETEKDSKHKLGSHLSKQIQTNSHLEQHISKDFTTKPGPGTQSQHNLDRDRIFKFSTKTAPEELTQLDILEKITDESTPFSKSTYSKNPLSTTTIPKPSFGDILKKTETSRRTFSESYPDDTIHDSTQRPKCHILVKSRLDGVIKPTPHGNSARLDLHGNVLQKSQDNKHILTVSPGDTADGFQTSKATLTSGQNIIVSSTTSKEEEKIKLTIKPSTRLPIRSTAALHPNGLSPVTAWNSEIPDDTTKLPESTTNKEGSLIPAITRLFRSCRVAHPTSSGIHAVDTMGYVTAYRDLVSVLDHFGVVFSFAASDIRSKLTTLETLVNTHRSQSRHEYDYLDTMLSYEFSPEGFSASLREGTDALRWSLRALKMISGIIREVRVKDVNGDLASRVAQIYQHTLAPHHSWFVRVVAYTALKAFPERKTLMGLLRVKDDEAGMQEVFELVEAIDDVCEHIDNIYRIYELE